MALDPNLQNKISPEAILSSLQVIASAQEHSQGGEDRVPFQGTEVPHLCGHDSSVGDPSPLEIPRWIIFTAVGAAHAMGIAWKLGASTGLVLLFGVAPVVLIAMTILMAYCATAVGMWVQNRLVFSADARPRTQRNRNARKKV